MSRPRLLGLSCASCGLGPLAPQKDEAAPWALQHHGRGLCASCHTRHGKAGTLEDFPRRSRRSVELASEAEILRRRGPYWTRARIATALGVSVAALDTARRRAGSRPWSAHGE